MPSKTNTPKKSLKEKSMEEENMESMEEENMENMEDMESMEEEADPSATKEAKRAKLVITKEDKLDKVITKEDKLDKVITKEADPPATLKPGAKVLDIMVAYHSASSYRFCQCLICATI